MGLSRKSPTVAPSGAVLIPNPSRVFFDEIGWPWPKHPCTDNSGSNYRFLKSLSVRTRGATLELLSATQGIGFDPSAKFRLSFGESPWDLLSAEKTIRRGFDNYGSPDGVSYRALAQAWILHPSIDLAAMPVECSKGPIPIYPLGEARVLARTITLGYPRIATAADTYVLAHGGELNAVVTAFDKQDYLIISNVVAPGNSGGPVLDESGICVGMVVRSFETRHEGGVSSANAALPATAILNFIALIL
jgi:hypothetical protein